MSNLLNKIKSSPTPKYYSGEFEANTPHQIPVDVFGRMKNRTLKIHRIALYVWAAAVALFAAYNMHECNKSFDNCLRLLEQIEVNSAILDQEINELSQAINGVEVDYE